MSRRLHFVASLLVGSILLGCSPDSKQSRSPEGMSATTHPAIATSKDLLALIDARNVDHVIAGLNDVKSMAHRGHLVGTLKSLWDGDQTLKIVSWEVVRLPIVRLEIGNVLVQAHRNAEIEMDLSGVHAYAREQLGSANQDAVGSAIGVLAMLNHQGDVERIKQLAAEGRHLRRAMLALNSMCVPGADAAAANILKDLRGDVRQELSESRQRMLDFKRRTNLCEHAIDWGDTDGKNAA